MAYLVTFAVASVSLFYLAFCAGPSKLESEALRPLAVRMGTETSKNAIVARVSDILESHIGSDRAEIHGLLATIGEFSYRGPYISGSDQTLENAYWTLAELPLGKIWAVWVLRYDSGDRLVSVEIGDSP